MRSGLWLAPVNVRPKRAHARQCCETQIAHLPDASSLPAWLITIITATASFFQCCTAPEARHFRAATTSGQARNNVKLDLNRQAHAQCYVDTREFSQWQAVMQTDESHPKRFPMKKRPRRHKVAARSPKTAPTCTQLKTPQESPRRLQDASARA